MHKDVALVVTMMVVSGKGVRDSRSCKKGFLFRIYDGKVSTRGCMEWLSYAYTIVEGGSLANSDVFGYHLYGMGAKKNMPK